MLTIAGVVQSKPYVKWALTPPKTLAQMGKSRVAIRTAIIESLSDVTGGGVDTLQEDISEASQALEIPEKTKQLALTLLGGETNRVLSVSGDPRGIEVDSSLSAPRQNIYFLSCVLDTIDTIPDPINPKFLKRTKR